MRPETERPKIKGFTLDDLDGNAHSLMGHFSKVARRNGWTADEIEDVCKEAMNGDYDHLIQTLMRYED